MRGVYANQFSEQLVLLSNLSLITTPCGLDRRAHEVRWGRNQVSSSSSGLSVLSLRPQSRELFLAKKRDARASGPP